MKTVEVLTKARELIADPEHWTQREGARNASGCGVDANDPAACKWCALGAVERISEGNEELYRPAYHALRDCAPDGLITLTNDNKDHPTVIGMFDCAIAKARA